SRVVILRQRRRGRARVPNDREPAIRERRRAQPIARAIGDGRWAAERLVLRVEQLERNTIGSLPSDKRSTVRKSDCNCHATTPQKNHKSTPGRARNARAASSRQRGTKLF